MAKKKKKKQPVKPRNLNRLMQDQGLINLSTRTGEEKKPKYSRKSKHKGRSLD